MSVRPTSSMSWGSGGGAGHQSSSSRSSGSGGSGHQPHSPASASASAAVGFHNSWGSDSRSRTSSGSTVSSGGVGDRNQTFSVFAENIVAALNAQRQQQLSRMDSQGAAGVGSGSGSGPPGFTGPPPYDPVASSGQGFTLERISAMLRRKEEQLRLEMEYGQSGHPNETTFERKIRMQDEARKRAAAGGAAASAASAPTAPNVSRTLMPSPTIPFGNEPLSSMDASPRSPAIHSPLIDGGAVGSASNLVAGIGHGLPIGPPPGLSVVLGPPSPQPLHPATLSPSYKAHPTSPHQPTSPSPRALSPGDPAAKRAEAIQFLTLRTKRQHHHQQQQLPQLQEEPASSSVSSSSSSPYARSPMMAPVSPLVSASVAIGAGSPAFSVGGESGVSASSAENGVGVGMSGGSSPTKVTAAEIRAQAISVVGRRLMQKKQQDGQGVNIQSGGVDNTQSGAAWQEQPQQKEQQLVGLGIPSIGLGMTATTGTLEPPVQLPVDVHAVGTNVLVVKSTFSNETTPATWTQHPLLGQRSQQGQPREGPIIPVRRAVITGVVPQDGEIIESSTTASTSPTQLPSPGSAEAAQTRAQAVNFLSMRRGLAPRSPGAAPPPLPSATTTMKIQTATTSGGGSVASANMGGTAPVSGESIVTSLPSITLSDLTLSQPAVVDLFDGTKPGGAVMLTTQSKGAFSPVVGETTKVEPIANGSLLKSDRKEGVVPFEGPSTGTGSGPVLPASVTTRPIVPVTTKDSPRIRKVATAPRPPKPLPIPP
ncbi:hypothetical protein HK102_008174, partial [Quaeritorhiza haematococci]